MKRPPGRVGYGFAQGLGYGLAFLLVVADVPAAGANLGRMMVADVAYAQVWMAAQEAVRDYPLERLTDGEIVTGWRDRPARTAETGFRRVAERVTLRVQPFEPRITRITVLVEVRGWRDSESQPIEDDGEAAHQILERVRAALR
jgi:hypothetical protein